MQVFRLNEENKTLMGIEMTKVEIPDREAVRAFTLDAPFPSGERCTPQMGPSESAVYRFYDDRGDLLYVGVSRDPFRRWRRHREKAWWPTAVHVRLAVYPSNVIALRIEREWIRNAMPRWNIRSAVA